MKLNDTRIRLIRGQLVTLLILALALAGYLLHFVPNQRRHVVERNFRVLAGMAQQIEIALGILGTSLTNAVSVRDGALVLRPDFPTNSPISHAIVSGRTRATNSTVSSAGAATNSTEALIGFVTGRLALVPAFQQVSVEPVAAGTKASGTIHWETKGVGKGSWIDLEYVGDRKSVV